MVLAGLIIAVGVVVDDAIIGIENIWRRLRQEASEGAAGRSRRRSSKPRSKCAARSSTRAHNVIVVVPIFFIEGLSGAFFAPLALSMRWPCSPRWWSP